MDATPGRGVGTPGDVAGRVLVVASTFPASDDDPVPAFVRDQVRAMHAVAPDLEFHVLAPHDGRSGTRDHVVHDAFDEHRFHYMWPRRWERLAGRGIMPALREQPRLHGVLPFFFLSEVTALLRLAQRLRPDTIYAHWFTPQGIAAAWVARLVGARFVFTTHAADVDVWRRIPVLGTRVVRFHAEQADRITAVSTRSLSRLQQFFDDDAWARLRTRTRIIPMGVPLPEPVATTPDATAPPTLVFVGRLAEKKGVQVLLEAVARRRGELAAWQVVVAGDGPWRARLEQQARDLGLDVDFPGYVTGGAKDRLIATADIFVVPSIITDDGDAEGLPVTLLEGLAAGRVCVATNESGADDVVRDGVHGFLVGHRDADALGDALVRAAHLDPADATAMRTRARQRAQEFAWPRIARSHVDFLFTGAPDGP